MENNVFENGTLFSSLSNENIKKDKKNKNQIRVEIRKIITDFICKKLNMDYDILKYKFSYNAAYDLGFSYLDLQETVVFTEEAVGVHLDDNIVPEDVDLPLKEIITKINDIILIQKMADYKKYISLYS